MKILSFTVENVYWVSQVLSFVLLAGTVVLGGVALFTGKLLNDKQGKELLDLSTKLEEQRQKTEEQREKTAKAEQSLFELRKMVLEPRQITPMARAKAVDILLNRVKGTFTMSVAETNSIEAKFFAIDLKDLLQAGGWELQESKRKWQGSSMFPGTTLIFGPGAEVKTKMVFPECMLALKEAIDALGFEAGRFSWQQGGISDLEENAVEIIIGPKH